MCMSPHKHILCIRSHIQYIVQLRPQNIYLDNRWHMLCNRQYILMHRHRHTNLQHMCTHMTRAQSMWVLMADVPRNSHIPRRQRRRR